MGLRFPSSSSSSPFEQQPAPPRLSKEEQEIFERLQRQSTGPFGAPHEEEIPLRELSTKPKVNQSPDSVAGDAAATEGVNMHPDFLARMKPEFEGDVNPKTGEVGGPKNEPLRWGAKGDWSFGGRVTDF
jgi:hypothetical protein